MPLRFVDRYKTGFHVIVEADEGFLLGGRTIDSGPVFGMFVDALGHMNAVIEMNVKAPRRVRLGKVVEFRGMISSFIHVPDRPRPRGPMPD
jgi:hypothetical protein